jgi:transcriptional regulator with XRE-family HTH domain
MGRKARMKPDHLPEKLRRIRIAFGLSQPEMLRRLGFERAIDARRISEFELGDNEPPLPVLLEYARVAGVHMEVIVDDELELPAQLPGPIGYEGLRRKSSSRKRKR